MNRWNIKILAFLITLLCLFNRDLRAGFFDLSSPHTYGPLTTRTQNPLYLLFLSGSLERASTLPQKRWAFGLETTFSNLFEFHPQAAGVGLDLDMELLRTAFNVAYGLTPRMEAGLQIPFLSFSGGFLDQFIQDYHGAFGFPNGGRELVDNGRFSYLVTRDGAVLHQTDQASFRLSDAIVWHKIRLFDETRFIPAFSLKTSLKLPTGSGAEGTGSRRPDFGLGVSAEKSWKRFHSYTHLGLVVLGGHAELSPILKKGGMTFGQGVEVNVTEHLSFVGQLSGNTSFFKNVAISELTDEVFDLTFGLTGEFPLRKTFQKITYQAAFTEDPMATNGSVDFALSFNLGVEY